MEAPTCSAGQPMKLYDRTDEETGMRFVQWECECGHYEAFVEPGPYLFVEVGNE